MSKKITKSFDVFLEDPPAGTDSRAGKSIVLKGGGSTTEYGCQFDADEFYKAMGITTNDGAQAGDEVEITFQLKTRLVTERREM